MVGIRLNIGRDLRRRVWDDLLVDNPNVETAGFLYASVLEEGTAVTFRALDWYLVPDHGYSARTDRYLELEDSIRGEVIKRAHNRGLTLVEFHSHLEPVPPAFSYSDHLGFADFVPYVRWRLRDRPYLAIVVAETGFDGLAWLRDSEHPWCLDGLDEDGKFMESTGLSYRNLEGYRD